MNERLFDTADQLVQTIRELIELGLLEVEYDDEGEARLRPCERPAAAGGAA